MAKGPSEEQMREAFNLFDSDKDGRITPEDLGTVMRALGENPTQAELKSIMKTENINGPLEFQRFAEIMRRYSKGEGFHSQLENAFKVLDKENTGSISVKELKHILTNVGEKLDPSEFDEWIQEVKVENGKIRIEDFIARMTAK
eukprot:TRINITY_DN9905_c0_g1_i1.p1 TRINITY_DN9905_c0_g1~~TRINITY_DN9905_c0_g1_i1.p1  ORF type:complete len:144 (+),score=20.87 TRINITY_DN9905_c0_g1_i1:155-586(+)